MAIFDEEPEIRTRLEQLGIPLEGLMNALARGGGAQASATELHASSAGGTYLYHETTFALRLLLTPLGYDADEPDNQARVHSAQRGVSIVVQTGDENTGVDAAAEPRPRHARGKATERKINENSLQLSLFKYSAPAEDGERSRVDLTWILLVYVEDGFLQAELSLPREVDASGRACGWVERILLPVQAIGGGGTELRADRPDDDEGPITDIDVTWKQ